MILSFILGSANFTWWSRCHLMPPSGRGRFTNLVAELALAPRYRSVTFYLVAEVKLEPGCRSATCYLVAEVPPVTW